MQTKRFAFSKPQSAPSTPGRPVPGHDQFWGEWLAQHFPAVCTYPHGRRHIALWEWVEALELGVPARSRVDIWPRGGGKSTTGELGIVRCCVKLSRRFAIYLCETQNQANVHVQAIAAHLESLGIGRAVNQYGQAKGWKVSLLRTDNGFNVLALGLDSAARGVKLDQYRPDLILCDDIDNESDSLQTVEKKKRTLTTSILMAGAESLAVLFLQNEIHKNSIVSQLADNRAEFLLDREPAHKEPAVLGLTWDIVASPDGPNRYVITGGAPTWEGQGIPACQEQINKFGLKAFRRESQHEVKDTEGVFFRVGMVKTIALADLPQIDAACLAGDLAATEGAGDWTALCLLLRGVDKRYFARVVLRAQLSAERVKALIKLAREYYRPQYPFLRVHLPQDPGQAGKDQGQQLEKAYPGSKVESVSGPKWVRARDPAESLNLGNVLLVNEDIPDVFAPYIEMRKAWQWQTAFLDELDAFKEGVLHQIDDQVDAFSDAHTEIASGKSRKVVTF